MRLVSSVRSLISSNLFGQIRTNSDDETAFRRAIRTTRLVSIFDANAHYGSYLCRIAQLHEISNVGSTPVRAATAQLRFHGISSQNHKKSNNSAESKLSGEFKLSIVSVIRSKARGNPLTSNEPAAGPSQKANSCTSTKFGQEKIRAERIWSLTCCHSAGSCMADRTRLATPSIMQSFFSRGHDAMIRVTKRSAT